MVGRKCEPSNVKYIPTGRYFTVTRLANFPDEKPMIFASIAAPVAATHQRTGPSNGVTTSRSKKPQIGRRTGRKEHSQELNGKNTKKGKWQHLTNPSAQYEAAVASAVATELHCSRV